MFRYIHFKYVAKICFCLRSFKGNVIYDRYILNNCLGGVKGGYLLIYCFACFIRNIKTKPFTWFKTFGSTGFWFWSAFVIFKTLITWLLTAIIRLSGRFSHNGSEQPISKVHIDQSYKHVLYAPSCCTTATSPQTIVYM